MPLIIRSITWFLSGIASGSIMEWFNSMFGSDEKNPSRNIILILFGLGLIYLILLTFKRLTK